MKPGERRSFMCSIKLGIFPSSSLPLNTFLSSLGSFPHAGKTTTTARHFALTAQFFFTQWTFRKPQKHTLRTVGLSPLFAPVTFGFRSSYFWLTWECSSYFLVRMPFAIIIVEGRWPFCPSCPGQFAFWKQCNFFPFPRRGLSWNYGLW